MHTHNLLLLLFTTLLATIALATDSDFGQPWYDHHAYSVWRRRRWQFQPQPQSQPQQRRWTPLCSHKSTKLGEPCIENGKLTSKVPLAIAYPTLGPQPYRGEKIPEDMRFFRFVGKDGQSLGVWSMWMGGGGDVNAVREGEGGGRAGEEVEQVEMVVVVEEEEEEEERGKEVGCNDDVSDGDEKATVDGWEEVERNEVRDTIYRHHNTYFGSHVHKTVDGNKDPLMEKAVDGDVERKEEE